METMWFLYTTVLFAVALVSCSLSLAVWMATRRRDCLVSAAGFIIYALELSLIFFDEYSRTKRAFPQNFDAPLTHPLASAVLSVLFAGALWIWMLMRLHKKLEWKSASLPIAAYAVVALVLVPKDSMSGALQQWAYWFTRDLTIILGLSYMAWHYRHASSEAERLDLMRSRRFFIVACVLAGCIALEDTFMILIYHPAAGEAATARFFWFLSERNISENVLMVACAVQLLRKNQRVLSMYFDHPPVGLEAVAPLGAPKATGPRGARGVPDAVSPSERAVAYGAALRGEEGHPGSGLESRILLYSDKCGFSPREREVFKLLVDGRDTSNIASALVISPGTVKAHLSRMYKKAGVSGRKELVRDFWSS